MDIKYALIIDKRIEMSLKYKKTIAHDCIAHVDICHDLECAFIKITESEPDIILISDSIQEKFEVIIKKIRLLTPNYRPVIIALSKSSHLNDKLDALRNGADDFISEPIDISEFSARMFAHFRRYQEEGNSHVTNLPSENLTHKVIRRLIKSNEKWSMMFLDIDNFFYYHTLYGNIASEKMLKAFGAILRSALTKEDFLGQLNNDNFIIITNQFKAEKITHYLKYAFDSIALKFYSEEDASRGYLILNSGGKIGRKIPLVSTSIGVISNEYRDFESFEQILTHIRNIHHLAKLQSGSSAIFDTPKLCGSVTEDLNRTKKVLIVENDAPLAYLLTTTLELQGFETQATTNQVEAMKLIEKFAPDLIIFDAITDDFTLLNVLKLNEITKDIKIIVSTNTHDKEFVLEQGADLYLPKPYELVTLFTWINKLLDDEF